MMIATYDDKSYFAHFIRLKNLASVSSDRIGKAWKPDVSNRKR